MIDFPYVLEEKVEDHCLPEIINGEGVVLQRIYSGGKYFQVMCDFYQVNLDQDLSEEKAIMWAICNDKKEVVGTIYIDKYDSFEKIKEQVSDDALAKQLVDQGKFFELSYAVLEEKRGQRIGSKAVEAFIKNIEDKEHFFAVVDHKNSASIKILENYFSLRGTYVHPDVKGTIFLYY